MGVWDDLAVLDPKWAILSADGKKHDGWDEIEFFATGEHTVTSILEQAAHHGLPAHTRRAFDFGCGVGRLTRPLADRFDDVLGADISHRMLQHARGNCPTCWFEPVDPADLPGEHFDLVISQLVLQHVPARREKERLVGELVRILAPGGLLAFQLPLAIPARHRIQPRTRAYKALRHVLPARVLYRAGLHGITMSALPARTVHRIVDANGGTVLADDYLVTRQE